MEVAWVEFEGSRAEAMHSRVCILFGNSAVSDAQSEGRACAHMIFFM